MMLQVQPVKAGTNWPDATVVVGAGTVIVVVGGGSGPVNDSTNVSEAEPVYE